ncbi:MAG: tetratricopeptide repeat protein, partial [Rhodothermales bacterium]
GIPAVKLFVDGEVADEFTGALPEYAVRQWLEKALPSETKQMTEEAEAAIEEGHASQAETLLEAVLERDPSNAKAAVLLARLIVFEDADRAVELVAGSSFAGPSFMHIEEAVRTVARLVELDLDDLPDGEAAAAYADGVKALRRLDFEAALEHFIDVIQRDRYYDDDGARKACVALFALLGNDHPAVKAYRRRFDMALY